MHIYTRTIVLRLTCIIMLLFFMNGCSSVVSSPERIPVPPSETEKQLLQQGWQYYEQGDFEPALQKLQEALKLNPDNVEAIYAIAKIYLLQEKLNKSLEFSKLAATYKTERLPDIYLLIGKTYQRLDDPWNALRTYRFAVSAYPENPQIQYSLGATYVYLNKPELAAEAFKASITSDPYHADSHFQLGTLYYTNDYSTPALLSLSIALLLEPEKDPAPIIRSSINDLLERKEANIEKTDEGDFRSVDSALAAQRIALLNKSEKHTEFQKIKAQYHTLYEELNKTKIKNQKKTFVVDSYVSFYNMVYLQGLDETFVYYIFQGSEDKIISNWLDKHPGKIKQLELLVKKHMW